MEKRHPFNVSFLEQRYLLELYNKVGLIKSIVISSVIAFGMGCLVIIPINILMGGKILTGLVINLILCCSLLPYHLHQMVSLLSELDSMRKTMHDRSIRDELTQAYNRHYLQDTIQSLKDKGTEIPPNTSLLLIDLDDFKKINDRYGHIKGDEALRSLADICHTLFRSTDIFIRYGGDEFICLLPETNMEQALEIAQRLQNEIKQLTISTRGRKVKLTVSIGVAVSKSKQTLEKLIYLADKALYKAKIQGKNQVSIQ